MFPHDFTCIVRVVAAADATIDTRIDLRRTAKLVVVERKLMVRFGTRFVDHKGMLLLVVVDMYGRCRHVGVISVEKWIKLFQ